LRTVQFPTSQELAWDAQCVALALTIRDEQKVSYQEARLYAGEIVKQMVTEAMKIRR